MVVEVIAEADNKDIIKSNPYIDSGIFFSAREFFYDHPAYNELMYTVKNKTYDACFLFNKHVTPLNLLLAGVSAAPLRVSFAGKTLMPFINVGIRPKKEKVYEAEFQYPDKLVHIMAFNTEIIAGKPSAVVHSEIKWAAPDEMKAMDFLEADKEIIITL